MEPFADFLDYLVTKYTASGSFALGDNIKIGEDVDHSMKPDSDFPRLEILITKWKGEGYASQQLLDQKFRFSVAGYIRRESDTIEKEDMFNLIKFGRETLSMTMGLNKDKMSGITICDGFIQMGGFPEIFYEYELIPKIDSFILLAEADISLLDDFSNY